MSSFFLSGQLWSQTFFSDEFDGSQFVSDLEDFENAFFLANGLAAVTPNAGRNYVRTEQSDYLSTDFIADLAYVQTNGGGPAGVFFGIGEANRNPNFFFEPYPAIFFVDLASDFGFPGVQVRRWTEAGSEIDNEDVLFSDAKLAFSGPAVARVTKSGNNLVFSADLQFDGISFNPTFTHLEFIDDAAGFLDGTTSRVFFGTDASPTFFDRLEIRSFVLGDSNLDGAVDLLDVPTFVFILTTGGYLSEADTNFDGVVNLLDVDPFVDLLTGA